MLFDDKKMDQYQDFFISFNLKFATLTTHILSLTKNTIFAV